MREKVLVIGMGMSGRASCKFLLTKGYEVTGVDAKIESIKQHKDTIELCQQGIKLFADTYPIDVNEYACVVLSPGIPPSHPLVMQAKQKGKKIWGEAELAFNELKGQKAVAITGTNGKTTVTLLVEHVLNSCGKKARALGNVGRPLTEYFIHPDKEEIVVAELSSYQLETLEGTLFDAGVLLNITPDHLDRYGSMDEYANAKYRLADCIKDKASFFVFADTASEFARLHKECYFTFGHNVEATYSTDGHFVKCREKIEYIFPIGYRQEAVHDSINALAAWVLCKQLGVTSEQFCRALETFTKPSHRIEFVTSIDGVSYFDDSKGTNIDAVIQAVRAMKGPVILIAGGVDKGASYLPWKELFSSKVKEIFAIGQAASKIHSELHPFIKVTMVPTLSEAVEKASQSSSVGDYVLLSPGCSSFDMFRDYAHRGEEFKKSVNNLRERRQTQ